MSSFGSYGSLGGVGARTAAPRSSAPQPVEMSHPGRAMSRAERRRISATWSAERRGLWASTQAAAALTMGAAKLVPSQRE